MRIVIFTSYFLPHRGGVENYVYQTAKRLAKRNKVFVVTTKLPGTKSEEFMDGFRVIRLPGVELLSAGMNIQLPLFSRVVEKVGSIDVIVTNTRFYPLTVAAGMFARLKGIPWLHIEHGTKQVAYENPFVRMAVRAVDATTGTWVLNSAHVAGVSEASCVFARQFGAKSCTVLYNGVDTKFFDGQKKAHKGVRVVFVGRLIKEKGVGDLLKAAKGLKAEVIIVGKGSEEKELKKLGGIFVGEKDAKGVRKVLSECDILVNPSYGEGLPTAVLEAGAMGLAVIATDVGGTREIIDSGNGFLVHPGNVKELRGRLKELIDSARLRARFGSGLQKTVRAKFDWDIIAKKFEKVLKAL